MSSEASKMMSKFVGRFIDVIYFTSQKEGTLTAICYCKSFNGKNFTFVSEYNQEYILGLESIVKIMENVHVSPKYSIGELVGVETGGYPLYYDTITKNAKITNIHIWYNSVKYDVRFDDGEVVSRIPDGKFRPYVKPVSKDDKELERVKFLLNNIGM